MENRLLKEIEDFTPKQIEALSAHWISTAQDFISSSSTDAGKNGLIKLLGITKEEFETLLKRIQEGFSEKELQQLKAKPKTNPMGVVLTDSQKEYLKQKKIFEAPKEKD